MYQDRNILPRHFFGVELHYFYPDRPRTRLCMCSSAWQYYANRPIMQKMFKVHDDLKTIYTYIQRMDDIDISQGLIYGTEKPPNFTTDFSKRQHKIKCRCLKSCTTEWLSYRGSFLNSLHVQVHTENFLASIVFLLNSQVCVVSG